MTQLNSNCFLWLQTQKKERKKGRRKKAMFEKTATRVGFKNKKYLKML